jgi:hypothetical protein
MQCNFPMLPSLLIKSLTLWDHMLKCSRFLMLQMSSLIWNNLSLGSKIYIDSSSKICPMMLMLGVMDLQSLKPWLIFFKWILLWLNWWKGFFWGRFKLWSRLILNSCFCFHPYVFSINIFLPNILIIKIPLPFQHKLNYYLFYQTFQIIYAKNLIKSKVQLLGFELQTFHDINL